MLAIYFDGKAAIKEQPRPEPGDGEVLVRVLMAGICGTDLQVLKGYHDFTGIMGHEFVGKVGGPEASPWLGKRVVGEINIGCGNCDLCRRGLGRHCRQRRGCRTRWRFLPSLWLRLCGSRKLPRLRLRPEFW